MPSNIHSNVSCRAEPKSGVEGGCQAAVPTHTEIFKKLDFVGTILNIIHDSPFSRNWPPGLSSDTHEKK